MQERDRSAQEGSASGVQTHSQDEDRCWERGDPVQAVRRLPRGVWLPMHWAVFSTLEFQKRSRKK